MKFSLFPNYAPAVEPALFLLGYRNLCVYIVGHVGLSILVAAGAWMVVPHYRVLIWSGWMLSLSLVFGLGYWMFHHCVIVASVNVQELSLWRTVHLWMVTLPGLSWGSIGFLWVQGEQVSNLMAMTSFADALAYSAATHSLVLNIAATGQAIGMLFNARLELSRLESGMCKPAPSSCNLLDFLTQLLARTRPEADCKSMALRSHVSAHLLPLVLHTDKLLLGRVLGNLQSNAVRHTERGGVLLSLQSTHGGGWLEVWDTGLGIAGDDQMRIFDAHVQLANRDRNRSKGLGLWVAIVRHASELLGVGWSLHSRHGRGSCFRRHLPGAMCLHRASSPAPGLFAPTPIHPPGWPTGRCLLLVDDDPMIQWAQEAGYMVLFKPVDAALLASTLRTELDRCSAERPQ